MKMKWIQIKQILSGMEQIKSNNNKKNIKNIIERKTTIQVNLQWLNRNQSSLTIHQSVTVLNTDGQMDRQTVRWTDSSLTQTHGYNNTPHQSASQPAIGSIPGPERRHTNTPTDRIGIARNNKNWPNNFSFCLFLFLERRQNKHRLSALTYESS